MIRGLVDRAHDPRDWQTRVVVDHSDTIAHLRQAIGAIEATSADLPRLSPEARKRRTVPKRRPKPKKNPDGTWPPITYQGMPEGDDWLDNRPARYSDGHKGFDRRICKELAAVGVRCYTLNDLADRARTVPQGIPIFVDWLNHLEVRVPGPETEHRELLRIGLIRALDDPAARGNRDAIDAVVDQLRRRPPPTGRVQDDAEPTLARIATAADLPAIAAIMEELPPRFTRGYLIEYLGRVKTAEAQEIALNWLDGRYVQSAIKALIAMKATGVRARVERYVDDPSAQVRKLAKRALERLPD